MKRILPMIGSYEGDDPYVYACYARRDAEVVAQILAVAKKNNARIAFDPDYLPGAMTMIAFLSKNSIHDARVWRELDYARSVFMDVTCYYIDNTYLGKTKEAEYPFFRFIRLDDVSILQYGAIINAHFPFDVFPGPPKSVKSEN